jgi:hypothetical protein
MKSAAVEAEAEPLADPVSESAVVKERQDEEGVDAMWTLSLSMVWFHLKVNCPEHKPQKTHSIAAAGVEGDSLCGGCAFSFLLGIARLV